MACQRAGSMVFPLSSSLSSMYTSMPLCFRLEYRWLVKLFRVSLPLKLRNTSYIYSGGEEDEDEVIPCTLVEAMKIPIAIN
jgi:hypothetical protein